MTLIATSFLGAGAGLLHQPRYTVALWPVPMGSSRSSSSGPMMTHDSEGRRAVSASGDKIRRSTGDPWRDGGLDEGLLLRWRKSRTEAMRSRAGVA